MRIVSYLSLTLPISRIQHKNAYREAKHSLDAKGDSNSSSVCRVTQLRSPSHRNGNVSRRIVRMLDQKLAGDDKESSLVIPVLREASRK